MFGLSSLSRFVALQVSRFGLDGSKSTARITGPWEVSLPHFQDSTGSVTHIPYVTHSIILHEGDNNTQGHYRAVLLEAGALKYITSDGKRATKLSPKISAQLGSQLYIAFLERAM